MTGPDWQVMMNRQLPTIDRLYGSEDLHESARAFAERRDPVWQGK